MIQYKHPYQLKLNNRLIDLSVPVVMGIVNVTPDSFFAKSRVGSDRHLLSKVEQFIEEGAAIIDLGGYSTRPNAENISIEEEIRRLSDALSSIRKKYPEIPISIDTFRSEVARELVAEFGVQMINDISGGTLDPLMFETVADLKVAYVLMHTRGTPETMTSLTQYDNLISDVFSFLTKRVAQLRMFGVNDVVIDPGFGFAKTLEQNYKLLSSLSYFHEIGCPVLAGLSRKSMIYKYLETDPEHALNGTTALNMAALMEGASILRVHDVKEAVETIRLFDFLRDNS